jgi:putative peptidoglycan lipid II flippase
MAGKYGIRAIVVSVIIGAFLHLAIQYSEVRKLGYRPKFDFGRSPELREILRTMVPRGLTQGVGSIVAIVYNNLGSSLILGSIMVFNFMNDLQTTPTVVIANSMAIAFFPSISAKLNTDDKEGANVLLDKVIRASLFLLIPCVAILFILRAQVVRLYIGIGGADWTLTYLAINSLVWFLVGIIPASLSTILGRVFYALKEVRLPLILGAISGLAGILVAVIGIKVLHGDATVLAAAVSVAAWVQLILYIFALRRYGYFRVNFRWLLITISRSLGASILMVAATWLTLNIVNYFYEATQFCSTHLVWGLLLQLILATAAGLLVYLGYAKKTHPEEWRWVKESVSSRLR